MRAYNLATICLIHISIETSVFLSSNRNRCATMLLIFTEDFRYSSSFFANLFGNCCKLHSWSDTRGALLISWNLFVNIAPSGLNDDSACLLHIYYLCSTIIIVSKLLYMAMSSAISQTWIVFFLIFVWDHWSYREAQLRFLKLCALYF